MFNSGLNLEREVTSKPLEFRKPQEVIHTPAVSFLMEVDMSQAIAKSFPNFTKDLEQVESLIKKARPLKEELDRINKDRYYNCTHNFLLTTLIIGIVVGLALGIIGLNLAYLAIPKSLKLLWTIKSLKGFITSGTFTYLALKIKTARCHRAQLTTELATIKQRLSQLPLPQSDQLPDTSIKTRLKSIEVSLRKVFG